MSEHTTTFKLTIDTEDQDFQTVMEEYQRFMNDNPATFQLELETNAEEALDDIEKLNIANFDDLVNNFQTATEEINSESAQLSDQVIEDMARINVANFDDLVSNFQSATEQMKTQSSQSTEQIKTDLEQGITGAISGIAAYGLSDMMLGWADTAGDANSQFNRLGIALDNIGVGVGNLDTYKTAISQVSEATGRSASTVREFFILMSNQGVKSTQLISSTFQGIASAAYMMNTDIDSATSLFSRMITSGTLMSRSLSSAGISMDDFAKVMKVDAGSVSEAFKNMSAEQRASIMQMVLNNKYGSEANNGFKNSWQGLKTELDKAKGGLERFLGELLLPVFIPAAKAASTVVNGLTNTLRGLPGPVKSILGAVVAAGGGFAVLALGAKAVSSAMGLLNFGSVITNLKNLTGLAKTAGDASGALNTAGGAAKGGGGFLGWIKNMNLMAAEAAASTGPSALSLSALSAGIQTMLAPLLMVAAVVAIMIPIIFGIAAEIAIFVRLFGELIKALAFDKLNLGPAIEGIKQIGAAIWEIGVAFTTLTLINIVNIIYMATGGIVGTGLALAQFWIAAKAIEATLNNLKGLEIDPNVVTTITNLSNVLKGISEAMLSMAALNLAGFISLVTGGVLATVMNIKVLEEIAKVIKDLNIPPVDESKIELVKQLATVVKSLSEASLAVSDATGWFHEKVLNIDDVEGIQASLRNLGYIATNINNANIPSVDKGKVELVNALANVIKPLAEAAKAVDEAQGFFGEKVLNIDDVTGMEATLRNLGYIATNINNANIPNVGKDKIDAIRNINNAIQPIVAAAKSIDENAKSIAGLDLMTEPFKKAIDALDGINQKINEKGFNLDPAKITAITSLKTVIQRIAEIGLYISQNSGNIGSHITDNAENIKKAIQSLDDINQKINSMPLQIDESKTAAINALKTLIQTIINTLNSAAGIKPAASNMGKQIVDGFKAGAKNLGPSTVTIIASAVSAVQNRYGTMRSAGNALGQSLSNGFKAGAGLNSPMAAVVKGINDSEAFIKSKASAFYTAGAEIGSAIQSSYRAQNFSTTESGYNKLINENKNELLSVFKDKLAGLSVGNGSGVSNTYVFTNPLIEKNAVDYVLDVVDSNTKRENNRS